MFTYEVEWLSSQVRWASRWDTYLAMSDVQIHWFSIINSVVVVFFLAGLLHSDANPLDFVGWLPNLHSKYKFPIC